MKLVARWQGYIIAVFTAWHRIDGVKLHHYLNYVSCHPKFLVPKCRCGHPTGHPKLLQLETPLLGSAGDSASLRHGLVLPFTFNLPLVVLKCYRAKCGGSTALSSIAESSTSDSTLSGLFPRKLGARNLIISKLAKCNRTLKILSQFALNFLRYPAHKTINKQIKKRTTRSHYCPAIIRRG